MAKLENKHGMKHICQIFTLNPGQEPHPADAPLILKSRCHHWLDMMSKTPLYNKRTGIT